MRKAIISLQDKQVAVHFHPKLTLLKSLPLNVACKLTVSTKEADEEFAFNVDLDRSKIENEEIKDQSELHEK
jgi:hypothetical protein